MPGMIVYVYMIKKNTLQKRLEDAKKKNLLTLLDLLDIILNKKGQTLWQK